MSDRDPWILALLRESDGKIEGRTRLMKLAFLLDRTLESRDMESPFEFDAYKHGPFDKGVLDTLDRFSGEETSEEVVPTPQGEMYVYELNDSSEGESLDADEDLGYFEKRTVRRIIDRWEDIPTQALVGYVYDTYPEYTPD